MTIEINENESPESPASNKKSPFVVTPGAAWILVISVIALLVGLFALNQPVVPPSETTSEQKRVMRAKPKQKGLKTEQLVPILSPHLGNSGQH